MGARQVKKEGIHGFKAFLIFSGSGVLAGLLVVWIISSLVKAIFVSGLGDSSSGGIQTGSPVVTWEPPLSMEQGSLDLCRSLETSGQAGAFREMGPVRISSEDNYSDPGPDAEDRIVQDDCTWEVYSSTGNKWIFSLSYKVFAGSFSDEQRLKQAKDLLSEEKSSVNEKFDSLINEELMADMADESFAYYGLGKGGEENLYIFLGRTRSGVFCIEVKIPVSSGGSDLEVELRTLIRKLVPVIDIRLERMIPA